MVNVTYVDKQGMYLWVNTDEHKFTRVTQHNYVVNTYIDRQGMDKQGYPCVFSFTLITIVSWGLSLFTFIPVFTLW